MFSIFCKLEFWDTQNFARETIIGKISSVQLLSDECQWITVRNRVHQNRRWEKFETLIHKDDIQKIWFYEEHSYIDIDQIYPNMFPSNKGEIA